MPPLFPSNVDAIKVWNLVSDQRIWVGGMAGIKAVALKHEPIWKLIDEFRVEDRIGTFEKVILIFNHIRKIEEGNQKKG